MLYGNNVHKNYFNMDLIWTLSEFARVSTKQWSEMEAG